MKTTLKSVWHACLFLLTCALPSFSYADVNESIGPGDVTKTVVDANGDATSERKSNENVTYTISDGTVLTIVSEAPMQGGNNGNVYSANSSAGNYTYTIEPSGMETSGSVVFQGYAGGLATVATNKNGGAFYMTLATVAVNLTNADFRNYVVGGQDKEGGGAFFGKGTGIYTINLTNVNFYNNELRNLALAATYTMSGGAMHLQGGDGTSLTMNKGMFSGNRINMVSTTSATAYGGALFLKDNADVSLTDVQFDGNRIDVNVSAARNAEARGGALYATGTYITLTNVVFTSNTITTSSAASRATNYGGALYAAGATTLLTINGGTFAGNVVKAGSLSNSTASGYGGAIYFESGTLKMDSVTVTSNTVSVTVSDTSTSPAYGGGLSMNDANVTLTNVFFSNNMATTGAGNNGKSSVLGGAVHVAGNNSILTINGGTFSRNQVNGAGVSKTVNGGALYVAGNSAVVTASGATFEKNYAQDYGGAVYMDLSAATATGTFKNDVFTSNTATNGGALGLGNQGLVDVAGSRFEGNYATGNGGAIAATNFTGTLILKDALFISNSAGASGKGGTVYLSGNKLNVYNTIIGASASGYSLYKGSKDSNGNTSITFASGSNATHNLTVDVGVGGVLDMQDPMGSDSNTSARFGFTGTMIGGGLWKIGGKTALSGSFGNNLTISSGTLGMYSGASITLESRSADSFTLGAGGKLAMLAANTGGSSVAATGTIKADTITINSGASFIFDLTNAVAVGQSGETTSLLLQANDAASMVSNWDQYISISNVSGLTSGSRYNLMTLLGGATFDNYDSFTSNLASLGSDFRFGLSDDQMTLMLIYGTVSRLTSIVYWNNQLADGIWNTTGATNWDTSLTTDAADKVFRAGDAVVFGASGTAAVDAGRVVTVDAAGVTIGAQTVASVTNPGMSVVSGTWTFQGGAITGGDIEFTGDGGLIFDGVNATGVRALDQRITVDAGVQASLATVSGQSLLLANNTGNSSGGAMNVGSGAKMTVKGNAGTPIVFASNTVTGATGGAIYTAGLLNLEQVELRDNTTNDNGGAVYMTGASGSFKDVAFDNNASRKSGNGSASLSGGALYATAIGVDGVQLQGVRFSNNQIDAVSTGNRATALGGAVYANGGSIGMNNVTFASNAINGMARGAASSATAYGGAVYLTTGVMTINTGTFTNNKIGLFSAGSAANGYGGAVSVNNASATMDSVVFAGNSITGTSQSAGTNIASYGGALHVASGTVTLNTTGTFADNTIMVSSTTANANGFGGAVSLSGNSSVATMNNVVFSSNTAAATSSSSSASGIGGAIYMDSAALTIVGGTFSDNRAHATVDASSPGKAQAFGGAIYAAGSGNVLTGTNMVFRGNSALSNGGAIYGTSGAINFTDALFEGNSALSDGGAVYTTGNGSTYSGTNIVYKENSAGGDGGAVYANSGMISLTDILFNSNTANRGGGFQVQGGATATITNGTFSGNKSSWGGAIYATGNGTLITLNDVLFSNNISSKDAGTFNGFGGAIMLNTGTANINITNDTLYSGNIAKGAGSFADAAAGGFIYIQNKGLANVDIAAGKTLTIGTAADTQADSIYVDSGTLALTNSGTLVLHASSGASKGTILVKSGALYLGNDNASIGGDIRIADNATLGGSGTVLGDLRGGTNGQNSYIDVATGKIMTVAATIDGGGAFTKTGAGTVMVTGSSTGYNSTISVNAGAMLLGANSVLMRLGDTGRVNVRANATFGGSGTSGASVFVENSATLLAGLTHGSASTGDILTISNTLSIADGAFLKFDIFSGNLSDRIVADSIYQTGAGAFTFDLNTMVSGSYNLLTSAAGLGSFGIGGLITTHNGSSDLSGYTASYNIDGNDFWLILQAQAQAAINRILNWKGNIGNAWLTDANWLAALNATNFTQGDIINLDGSTALADLANNEITLATTATVAGMYVSGNQNYAITGAGAIVTSTDSAATTLSGSAAATGKLVLGAKANDDATITQDATTAFTGTLDLTNQDAGVNNHFAGGVEINTGALRISSTGQLGTTLSNLAFTGTGALIVAADMTFDGASGTTQRLTIGAGKSATLVAETGATLTLSGNNSGANDGGAVIIGNDATFSALASTGGTVRFENNTAAASGGAIALRGTGLVILNANDAVFDANKASVDASDDVIVSGGAIDAFYSSSGTIIVNVQSARFESNKAVAVTTGTSAEATGGAINFTTVGGTLNAQNAIFMSNTASAAVGSGAYDNKYAAGGAIYTKNGWDSTINIQSGTFIDNSAIASGTEGWAGGGAIRNEGANIYAQNAYFGGNVVVSHGDRSSAGGGAIDIGDGFVDARGAIFTNNSASATGIEAIAGGGAIGFFSESSYVRNVLNVTNATFTNNRVISDSSIAIGGAIVVSAGTIQLGATSTGTSLYSGNTVQGANTGGVAIANSVHYWTVWTDITANINVDANGLLDMHDPMGAGYDADYYTGSGDQPAPSVLAITKTGGGEWRLSGTSILDGSQFASSAVTPNLHTANIAVNQGMLRLTQYAAIKADAVTSTFSLSGNSTLMLDGGNTISAQNIAFNNTSAITFASVAGAGDTLTLTGTTAFDGVTLNIRIASLTSHDQIAITGSAYFVNTSTFAINASMLTTGSYALLTATAGIGYASGNLANSSTLTGLTLSGRASASLVESADHMSLWLLASIDNKRIYWTNLKADNLWSSTNWLHSTSIDDTYAAGDFAEFTSASGDIVHVNENALLAGMAVTSGTYVFHGTGTLASIATADETTLTGADFTQALAIGGSGTSVQVTLGVATDFAKGVTLDDNSTLFLGNDRALGVYSGGGSGTTGVLTLASSGTIAVASGTSVTATSRIVSDNASDIALDIATGGTLTLQNVNAGATANGGAIYTEGNVTLTGEGAFVLTGNVAETGGAVYAGGDITLTGTVTASNNSATVQGGVFYAGGAFTATDASLSLANNRSDSDYGGAIYASGAIAIGNANTQNTLTGNYADGDGGAIYSDSTITLNGLTIINSNTAGGGVGYGGALAAHGITLTGTVSGTDNYAVGNGGAIMAYNAFTATGATLSLTANRAGNSGGAIYANDNIAIGNDNTKTTFTGNRANTGDGGAIYADGNVTISSGVLFSNNTAGNLGGAIYATGDVTLNVAANGTTAFAGNMANGKTNAIHMNVAGGNHTFTADIASTGLLDIADSISGTVANGRTLTITGTGGGLWKLGGTSAFTVDANPASNITFTQHTGTLQLYNNALINLGGADATFALGGSAVLDLTLGDTPSIVTGSFVSVSGAVINIADFAGSTGLATYTGTEAAHVLISASNAITRNYSITLGGNALGSTVTESVFLTAQEITTDATKVQLGTGLVWNNTVADTAHGTFQIDTGTFTLAAALADNTTAGAPMSIWDGKTLKKTGTGTLILTATNTYTGTTLVTAGELRNTGNLAGKVSVTGGLFQNTGTVANDLANAAHAINTGNITGLATNTGTLANTTGALLATLEQTSGTADNAGYITSATINGGGLDNTGTLTTAALLNGTLSNNANALITTLTQTAGVATNTGTITLAKIGIMSDFTNNSGATITTLDLAGGATNYGLIITATANAGSALSNNGTIATLDQLSGYVANSALGLITTATLNGANAELANSGTVTTAFVQAGLLTNNGVLATAATITGGTLANTGGAINAATTIGAAGTLLFNSGTITQDITNNGMLNFANAAAYTQAHAINGTGTLAKTGAGDLTLATAVNLASVDVQSGKLTVAGTGTLNTTGLLNIGATSTLGLTVGTGTSVIAGSVNFNDTGKLDITGYTVATSSTYPFDPTAARTVIHTTGNSILGFSPANVTIAGAAAVDYLTVTATTTLADIIIDTMLRWTMLDGTAGGAFTIASGTFTVNAPLGDNTSAHAGWDGKSLTKLGAGTLILGGVNTYTGTTAINDGELRNTGVIAGALVNVAAGSVLANSGTITAAVTNNATATNTGLISGAVTNAALFTNSGAVDSVLANTGTLANAANATLATLVQTAGTTANAGLITASTINGGGLLNTGTLTTTALLDGTLTNNALVATLAQSGGMLANNIGATITAYNATGGTATNAGLIASATLNGAAAEVTNTGIITTTLVEAGLLTNNGTLATTVTVDGGTLANTGGAINAATTIGAAGTLLFNSGTITQDITNNGLLNIANTSAYTQSNAINGTGTLAKTGAGDLTIATAAVNLASADIQTGKLTVADTGTLSLTGSLNIGASSTLGIMIGTGTSVIADSVNFNNTGKLDITGYTVASTATTAYPATPTAARTVIHTTGNSILGFSSTNVSVSSQTTVDFLKVTATTTAADIIIDTMLRWNMDDGAANGTFTLAAGQTFTIAAPLADNTSTHAGWDGKSLTKLGAGTLILAGVNTYTGTTAITVGELRNTGVIAGALVNVAAGSVLDNSGTITAAITNNATATNTGLISGAVTNTALFTNSGSVSNTLTNTGTFTNNLGATLATLVQTAGTTANAGYLGSLTNAGGITTNSGTIAIAPLAHAFVSGGTLNNISGGVIGDASVGLGTLNNSGTIGTLNLFTLPVTGTANNLEGGKIGTATVMLGYMNNAAGATINSLYQTGTVANAGLVVTATITGGILANTGTITTLDQHDGTVTNNNLITTATVAGGNLTNNANAHLAALTQTGGAAANAGLVTAATVNGGLLANTTGTLSGATTIGATGTVRFVSGTLAAVANNGVLDYANTAAYTQTAALTGAGTLNKTGAGDLILAANDTQGAVNVTTGKLIVAAPNTLTVTNTLSIANDATLGVTVGAAPSVTAGAVTFNATGKLDITGYTAATGSTYPFVPSAAATVIHTTGGVTGFNAANVTVAGATSVDFLKVSAYATATDVLVDTMLTWNLTDGNASGNFTLAAGQTFTINAPLANNTGTHAGWDGSSLNKLGAGTLVLAGVNTYTGTTTVGSGTLANQGVLAGSLVNVAAGNALLNSGTINAAVANNASTTNNGLINGVVTNNGTLTNAASATLANVVQNTGTTTNSGLIANATVNNGGLRNTGTLANASLVNGTLANSALATTLAQTGGTFANNAGATVTNLVQTAGAATNVGLVATATTTGNLTNTGTVATLAQTAGLVTNNGALTTAATINGGTLANTAGVITAATTIGGAGTLLFNSGSLAAPIANNGAVNFANAAAYALNQVISGNGALAKTGAGNLALAVPQTYSGETTVATGTLITSVANALPNSSRVSLAAGAALDLAGNNQALRHLALANAARVNFGGSGTTNYTALTLDALSGSGEFHMRANPAGGASANDTLTITGAHSGTHSVVVDLASAIKAPLRMITSGSTSGNALFTGTASYNLDAYSFQQSADGWQLARGGASEVGDVVLSTAAVFSTDWLYSLDSLHLRMGDLRAMPSANGDFWVRTNAYRLDGQPGAPGDDFKQNTWGVTAGIDGAIRGGQNAILVGGFVQIDRHNRTYDHCGNSNTSTVGAGVYGTALFQSGWYIDATLKYDRSKNDLNARTAAGAPVRGSYNNGVLGISAEAGRRISFGSHNRCWIEPSVQVATAWIGSAGYKTNDGMRVTVDSSNAFQYRAQIRAGVNYGSWTPYLKLAGAGVSSNGGAVRADDSDPYAADFDGGRFETGFGMSLRVSEESQLYFDYEYNKSSGIVRPWSLNLGYRKAW